MNEKELKFKGKIIRCVYNSEDYKTYAVDVDKNNYNFIKFSKYGSATICGNIHELGIGQSYEIVAIEQNNSKYGYSYKVVNIRKDKPLSENDIYIFLQEILTFNQASALWQYYPDIVDRVINGRLEDINFSKLKGIGETTFESIKTKIIENYALCDLVIEFNGVLTISMLKKLYDKYPSIQQLKNKLKEDPYKCLCGLSGVGFITADNLLLDLERNHKLEFDFDLKSSKQRCLSCIIYLLEKNEEDGNTKMDLRELRKQVIKQVPACANHFVECIKDKSIYYNKNTFNIAIRNTYDIEKYIADEILNGIKNTKVWDFDWESYKSKGEYELTDEQLSALGMLCNNNIMILNGFGGSGKSATASMIIQMLEDNNKTYKLFAPTGRASKVLSDYSKKPASTIHRGLGYIPPSNWTYNQDNKLECDVLIIDEFSMTDIFLFNHVINAIDFSHTKLLMIGDAAQLPSVSSGNLFHDFIQSKVIPTTTLSKIFRYGEGGLMTVATDVRNGKPYLSDIKQQATYFGNNKDYAFIEVSSNSIIKNTVESYKKLLKQGHNIEDIQILSSYNKGNCGTVNINNHIQKIANKNYGSSNYISIGDTSYYEGDIIIQCVNNYKAQIYIENDFEFEDNKTTFIANGETGIIKKIINQDIIIDFDGTLVKYAKSDMLSIKLGYAISIHKSQGGSAKIIILLTPSSHMFFLNSNLIYVGLTRMKDRCFHLGNKDCINKAVKKKANFQRMTFMQGFLTN